MIEIYDLIVNNDTDFLTCLASYGIFIIDLALTSPKLDLLWVWEIPEKYPSFLDHELILMEWEDIQLESQENQQPIKSRWDIQNLLQDKKLLQAAHKD